MTDGWSHWRFSGTASPSERETLVLTVAGAVAFAYAISLILLFANHGWILDNAGRPILDDFVVFWAAGREALGGAALAAYDAHRLHAAEVAAIGRNFSGWLVWSYPPVFLLVAALLASLPFACAFAVWIATTLALHAYVVSAISERRIAFVVACAMPWILRVILIGQNGLMTSAIVGVVLLQLEKRPVLAGFALGLLSYKPQFGILFPLALAAGGYWRAFGWAAAGTLAWNGLAGAVFGFGTFAAFFHALSATTVTHLVHNAIGWSKLQSAYGFARFMGMSGAAAWTAQGCMSTLVAIGVVLGWRSALPFALKAAVLAAAIPLATPYIFVDDLPMLAIAAAFLFRHRQFDGMEFVLLAVTIPCVCISLGMAVPSALFAEIAMATIVLRRCYGFASLRRINPSCDTDATSVPSSA